MIEAAHTLGVCLLLFRVLPQFDVVRSLMLMCATCCVPAILKLLLTKGNRNIATILLDAVALLMQASALFLITLFYTRYRTPLPTPADVMQCVAGLLLVSVRYWENFVERDIGSIPLRAFRTSLERYRCKIYLFASIWKICLTLAFAYLLVPNLTPMRDIFLHVSNETAFDNSTNARQIVDSGEIFNKMSTTPDFNLLEPLNAEENSIENLDNTIQVENTLNQTIPSYDQPTDSHANVDTDNDNLLITAESKRRRRQVASATGATSLTAPLDNALNDKGGEDEGNDTADRVIAQDDGAAGEANADKRRNRKHPEGGDRRIKRPRGPLAMEEDYVPTVDELDYNGETVDSAASDSKPVDKVLFRFLPLIVQIVSSAICYYFARVTCKLCMQGFSFALPLTLTTPTTLIIFVYFCDVAEWSRLFLPDIEIGAWRCPENFERISFQWQIGCALGFWWLSQLWINSHVWFSRSERLAKVER